MDWALPFETLQITHLGFALGMVLVAAFIRGYSGFAGPLIIVPSFSLIMAPIQVAPIVFMLELVTALVLVPRVWRVADWTSIRWIAPAALIGAPLGVLIILAVPAAPMALGISVMVLGFAFLFWTGFQLKVMPGAKLAAGAGLMSGVLNSATGIPGPPVILFYFSSPLRPSVNRASIVTYFSMIHAVAVALALYNGILTGHSLMWFLILAPMQALGVWLGNGHFLKTDEEAFRRAVLILIFAIGIIGALKALATMLGVGPFAN